MKQINARIPDDLHRAVKVKVARTGRSITEIINELLKDWVENDESNDDTKRKDNDVGR